MVAKRFRGLLGELFLNRTMQICKLISEKEKIAIYILRILSNRSIAVGSFFTKRTLNFLVCALVETRHVSLRTFLAQTMSPVHSHPFSHFYAGCPEGAYRVLKRVDFFFTRDALRGHTVS